MVIWSDYYRFSADEVECIGATDGISRTHPYTLTVHFKSGNKLSVNYADKSSQKAAMIDLGRQIAAEKRQGVQMLHNTLHLLRDSVNRIDKRQLRIWQQLKALLGVKAEEET